MVVGVNGWSTWEAALVGMARGAQEGAPEVQRAFAATRFFLAVHDGGKWPIPGARAKTLFRKLGPKETDRAIRHAVDDRYTYDQSASLPSLVQEVFLESSAAQTPASDRARIYELAVVGGDEYGEVDPKMREEVAAWAQESSERHPPRPDGSDQQQLAQQLETALETAREANDWERLAALRELVLSGRSHLNNNLTSLQTAAIDDTARWAKATHGPEIPPRLRETLREGGGLHELFYRQRPEFGDQPWMFTSYDGVLTLKLPSVVDYACQCWGEKWLDGLFEDFANGDTATQKSRLADRLGVTESAVSQLISGGWSRLKQGDPVLHDQLQTVQPPKT